MSASVALATPKTAASAVIFILTSPRLSDLTPSTLPSKTSTGPATPPVCCCANTPPAAIKTTKKVETIRAIIGLHRRRHVATNIHCLRQNRAVWLLIPPEDNDLSTRLEFIFAAGCGSGDHRLRRDNNF